MILTLHFLLGSAIASRIKPFFVALILCFLSHYFLDSLPHHEYSVKNIKEKNWKSAQLDFLKILLDISLGATASLFFAKNPYLALAGGGVAVFPDFLSFLSLLFSKNRVFAFHQKLHHKIHCPTIKEYNPVLKILSEIGVILLALLLFFK